MERQTDRQPSHAPAPTAHNEDQLLAIIKLHGAFGLSKLEDAGYLSTHQTGRRGRLANGDDAQVVVETPDRMGPTMPPTPTLARIRCSSFVGGRSADHIGRFADGVERRSFRVRSSQGFT